MIPTIALSAFMTGIAGLFFLDRDSSVRTSKALWLPVIWLLINGSRPLSIWLGLSGSATSGDGLPGSSPFDQLVAAILMVLGILVIVRRRGAISLLGTAWPVTLFFSYCLISVLWSDFSAWGLKRWIRSFGDLIMVLIPLIEIQPVAALRRLFSRVGFVLLPSSILLIRYFPNLGRGYDVSGLQMNTGVTTNKNELGAIAFVLALGTAWQVLRLVRDKTQPNRSRHLLAQCTLLSFGIWVLNMAHSATSGACFVLGLGLMVATARPLFRQRPAAVHFLVVTILLCGGLTLLLGGQGAAANAMGRSQDLTGRTDVWKVLIPMAPNPILGAGFETFWLGQRAEKVRAVFSSPFNQSFINEAHNGYIEAYLNLGLLGVGLMALLLSHGYIGAVAAFRHNPEVGCLLIAFILTSATYSITEAGFRMLSPIWFFLLLSAIGARRIITVSKGEQDVVEETSNARKRNGLSRLPLAVTSRR
jgi:exopolysaccharide production protein ExoQ